MSDLLSIAPKDNKKRTSIIGGFWLRSALMMLLFLCGVVEMQQLPDEFFKVSLPKDSQDRGKGSREFVGF